jgi:photosystem II stability/assembly factor-like uncharacterized protein
VFYSADGGRRWRLIHPYPSPIGSEFTHQATFAATALWLNVEHEVYRGDLDGTVKPIGGLPGKVASINPINADEAIILLDDGRGAPRRWYATSDGGAHWTNFPDPCTAVAGAAPLAGIQVGRDGSRWASCIKPPGATPDEGPQHILVSTDASHTWHLRGALDFSLSIYPVSATVAWALRWPWHIYRSTDGTGWNNVVPSDPAHPTNRFLVIDADTALAAGTPDGQEVVQVRTTRDGGTAWTTHPFTPS